MLRIKLYKDSMFSHTKTCIFCFKKLGKRHLCSELYVYTLLLPIFSTVWKRENVTLFNLGIETLNFIKNRNLFQGLDISDVITKYTLYFIADYGKQ